MKYYLDIELLARLVRSKRLRRGLRETAKEIGNVSPSTISRMERGCVPDMVTFLLLCEWLEVPPEALIKSSGEQRVLDNASYIAVILRGDKSLDPAISDALATLVEVAYRDLQR